MVLRTQHQKEIEIRGRRSQRRDLPRTGARGLKMEIAAFRFSGGLAAGSCAALLASL
jgi:hypothetical protein